MTEKPFVLPPESETSFELHSKAIAEEDSSEDWAIIQIREEIISEVINKILNDLIKSYGSAYFLECLKKVLGRTLNWMCYPPMSEDLSLLTDYEVEASPIDTFCSGLIPIIESHLEQDVKHSRFLSSINSLEHLAEIKVSDEIEITKPKKTKKKKKKTKDKTLSVKPEIEEPPINLSRSSTSLKRGTRSYTKSYTSSIGFGATEVQKKRYVKQLQKYISPKTFASTLMYKPFRSRGEKILSLVPKLHADSSDGEVENDVEEEALGNKTPENNLFGQVPPLYEVVQELELGELSEFDIPQREEFEVEDTDQNENVTPVIANQTKKAIENLRRKAAKNRKRSVSRKSGKRQKVDNIRWKWNDGGQEKFKGEVTIPDNLFLSDSDVEEPYQYFNQLFSQEIIDLITFQTNLYYYEQTENPGIFNEADILNFLAMEIIMGVVKMPSYTDYWAFRSRYEKIASVMSLKKYEKVRQYLHFADNTDYDSSDRYYKIRQIMNLIRKKCMAVENEKRQSIDEMMIPYKGKKAGSRRQYIRNKPIKWGFKMFVRAGISGIIYDFMLYDGLDTFKGVKFTKKEETFSMAPKVILSLCKSLPDPPALHAIYFDNFFSTLPLMVHLRKEYGILSLGTIRENRLRGLEMKGDRELKKEGRGSFSTSVDNSNDIVVVKWLDSKPVVLASTFVGPDPASNKNRWSQDKKTQSAVRCPQIVVQYNKHMGGVDLADMLIALYRTKYKTHKWYMNIFSTLLDICINNAWLLYRRNTPAQKRMRLKHFRLDVANGLLSKARTRPVGRPKSTSTDSPILISQSNQHLPTFTTKGRCRFCKIGQTSVVCEGCEKRLCLLPNRNCFMDAHNQR